MKKLLLALGLVLSLGAIPQKTVYEQFILAEELSDAYPNEGVCSIKLNQVSDVSDTNSTAGQCLKKNTANDAWVPGVCGNFTADAAQVHQSLTFIAQQADHNALTTILPTTAPTGWGSRAWSVEPNAIRGSFTGSSPPTGDVVLVSESFVGYSSTQSKSVKNIWLDSTKYAVGITRVNKQLGLRQVPQSSISPKLPTSGNWEKLKFEFTDGTFSPSTVDAPTEAIVDKALLLEFLNLGDYTPTQQNLYPVVEAIVKGSRFITITPSDNDSTLTFSLMERVAHHGVKVVRGASGVNRGASLTGSSKYGGIQTESGVDFTLQNTPIGRIEAETDDDNLVVYIRKSALSAADQARSVIYTRSYSGPPSSNNEVETIAMVKQADSTSDGIVWQVYFSGFSGPPPRAVDGEWSDNASGVYFRFFTTSSPTDVNTETLDFIEDEDFSTVLIDSKVPRQFRKDADVSGNYFQPSEFWSGTAAQEAALTKKTDGIYFIIP